MNRVVMSRFRRALLLAVLGIALVPGQPAPAGQEGAVADVPAPADVDAGRWQRLAGQLKANGLTAATARECLAPVEAAVREGLPPEAVLARIEEGVAKGAPAEALQEAGRQRLASLGQAAAVLRDAGFGGRSAGHDQLMKSVALALESGISAGTLKGVLSLGRGGQSERMRSIVEAGETMRLSGMDESIVGQVMNDFAERNMRRTEVLRASRFAIQQHESRVEASRIRDQLWDGTGSGVRWGRGRDASDGGAATGAGSPAERGGGPAAKGAGAGGGGSGARAGQDGPSGAAGNGSADAGSARGDSSPGGSGGPQGDAPSGTGPQGAAQGQGR